MWRPEDWKEIVKANVTRTGGFFNQDRPVIIEDERLLFEAGADAILEALKKEGRRLEAGQTTCTPFPDIVEHSGWLVFIKDE